METAEPGIKEVFSRILCDVRNNRYMLRVISFKNREGVDVKKFGISEFFYQADIKRWLPSNKHHVFLPMNAWPALVGHSAQIEKFSTNRNDVGHSGSSDEQRSVVDALDEDAAAKRQRGRPPKRVNDVGASTSNDSASRAAAPCPSHKKKDKSAEKKSREVEVSKQSTATWNGGYTGEYELASSAPATIFGGGGSKTTV